MLQLFFVPISKLAREEFSALIHGIARKSFHPPSNMSKNTRVVVLVSEGRVAENGMPCRKLMQRTRKVICGNHKFANGEEKLISRVESNVRRRGSSET